MFKTLLVLLSAKSFVLFARAESYVLLTANVDDLHAIANQLARSPVVEQLKDIWRRASRTFNSHVSKFRAEDSDKEKSSVEQRRTHNEPDMKSQRRQAINNLVQLGRNASVYLKKMFDSF